jgi:hypothetical protein
MLKPQLLNKFDRNDATIFKGRALIVRATSGSCQRNEALRVSDKNVKLI